MILAVHADKIDQRPNLSVPADTSAFLSTLLDPPVGLVEIAYCAGDPAIDKLTSAGWYTASDRQRIGQTITRLASRYGDVYISLSQHSIAQRTYSTALPGSFLWLDDLPEIDSTAAMVLETSQGNYQALYRLDQTMTAMDRAEWQRRARACSGADRCSGDATHMIRVPGGRNTKRGANWRVRLAHTGANIFSLAELDARWPVAIDSAPITGESATSLSESDVAAALARATELRKTAHHRLGENNLARRTLLGITEAPSQSEARYRIVYGLASVGFANEEIAALIWHWSNNLGTLTWGHLAKRSNADKLADIERCIHKARADLAGKGRQITIRPALHHRRMSPVPCTLEESRARTDRPQRLTAAALLSWLEAERAGDRALVTQQDIATAHGCSTGTVKRVERQLTVSGHITRVKKGRLTYVILLDHHRGGDDFIRSSLRHDLIEITTNTAVERHETECLDSINTPPYPIPEPIPEPEPVPVPSPMPMPVGMADGVGGGCVSNSPVRTWRHNLRPKELYTLLHGMRDCEDRFSHIAMVQTSSQAQILPEPEATIYGPPADAEKRRRYYALLGKAKNAKSVAQRRALEMKARELEEPIPKVLKLGDLPIPAEPEPKPEPVKPEFRVIPKSCGAKPKLTLQMLREEAARSQKRE